jgi:hypothetical protein
VASEAHTQQKQKQKEEQKSYEQSDNPNNSWTSFVPKEQLQYLEDMARDCFSFHWRTMSFYAPYSQERIAQRNQNAQEAGTPRAKPTFSSADVL